MHAPLDWLRAHDPGLSALRRAGRAALIMPAMFALGDKVIGNPTLATFAAFGSFAMLLLVDFTGPMRDRLQAQAALALVGGVLVCVGTIASRSTVFGAVAMALVAFAVLFAGVVSSVLAGATTSLLLAFILSVSLTGPISSIPDRLAGWGLAAGASLLAIAALWPAPERDPLRGPAIAVCRALAARLRSDVADALCGGSPPTAESRADAVAQSDAAVGALQQAFFATPYRPTGLGTNVRMVVRLVDELKWLNTIIVQSSARPDGAPVNRLACAVRVAAASVLEAGADLLDVRGGRPEALGAALAELRAALTELERGEVLRLPSPVAPPGSEVDADAGEDRMREYAGEDRMRELITSLDPDFRAQELSFVVSQIARNIDLAAAAERRSWLERLLGRQPTGLPGTLSAAQERAGAHVQRSSVWLHNSVRGAVGLALAVLIAKLTGVQHSFWVVLGALSVLRSNALATGQNVVRGLLGNVVGFIVGGALVLLVGTNTAVLWVLLPLVVLFAGLAPAAISFAAGQAAFTLTLLILYNILLPAGWQLGLVRIEDIALGAVEFGMGRCDVSVPPRPAPTDEAIRAAAASRRLDDTFRGYLAERGAKPIPLAEVTGLVNGAAGLRLAGDAVLDLWQRDDAAGGDRAAARKELLASTNLMVDWYNGFAASLAGQREVPEPLPHDELADGRLVDAVSQDLRLQDGHVSSTAARMIWTGDHLDAARRLQDLLIGPARIAAAQRALAPRWRILEG